MFTYLKKGLTLVFILMTAFLLVSCFGKTDPAKTELPAPKDVQAYKTLFADTFRNYQTATTEIPKAGEFDFEFTTNVDGEEGKLPQFADYKFSEPFSLLSTRLY